MRYADLSPACATLTYSVVSALVAAAYGMFERAATSMSWAAGFLAICLLEGAWLGHFHLYVVCGFLVQRGTLVPAVPLPHPHRL